MSMVRSDGAMEEEGRGRVLILEGGRHRDPLVQQTLEARGYRTVRLTYPGEGRARLAQEAFQVAVWHIDDPALDIRELQCAFEQHHPLAKIIALGEKSPTREAVLASSKLPLFDYLPLPLNGFQLLEAVDKAFAQARIDHHRHRLVRNAPANANLCRHLVESLPYPIYVLDADLKFVCLNRKLEALIGLGERECLGREVTSVLPELDCVALKRCLREAKESGAVTPLKLVVPFREKAAGTVRHLDGTGHRWLEVTVTPMRMPASRGAEKGLLGCYGSMVDITSRKLAERRLGLDGNRDPLAHLPDRRSLNRVLEMALQSAAGRVAVIRVSLKNVGSLTAVRGQAFGDKVLHAVIARLLESIRAGDHLRRCESHEFAVVLRNVRSEQDAASIARKLAARLNRPLRVEDGSVLLEPCLGCAVSSADCRSAEDLLRRASIALRLTSVRRGQRIRFYREGMNRAMLERIELVQDLRIALAQGRMEPYFQPIIDLGTGEVAGFEALARWPCGRGTVRTPATFLELVCELGLIARLDEIIQQKAIVAVGGWNRMFGTTLRLSLNVTTDQLMGRGFLRRLLEKLQRAHLRPELVTLEFVEYSHFPQRRNLLATLKAIRELGIKLAIDDFGTGYSSLSYLHQLPVDLLKIDQGFVRDLSEPSREQQVVAAIVKLSQALRLDCVAEGIESAQQAHRLLQMGCRYGQGYLFGKPRSRLDTEGRLVSLGPPAGKTRAAGQPPLPAGRKAGMLRTLCWTSV